MPLALKRYEHSVYNNDYENNGRFLHQSTVNNEFDRDCRGVNTELGLRLAHIRSIAIGEHIYRTVNRVQ